MKSENTSSSAANRRWREVVAWVLQRVLPPLVAAILFVAAWELSVKVWQIKDYLVPAPAAVAARMWEDRIELSRAWWLTGRAAVSGLSISLIVGTCIAIAFALSSVLRFALYPYAIFLQTVPVVALAPLLIMWFGFGSRGVIAVACVLSLFPIIANMTAGLMSVPAPLHELFTLYKASRWQRMFKLQFPYAVSNLMTGLKTSSGLSVIGAIVGEFFVGYGDEGFGLWYMIRSAAESYQTARLFAVVILSTVLGIVVFCVVSFIAELVVRRWGNH